MNNQDMLVVHWKIKQKGENMIEITKENLVQLAKDKYPVSIHYTGRLSEEEVANIEKTCNIHCPSVYMDGSATYSIRYKK